MRLLKEEDVIRAIDKHTGDDDRLDDDITCILEKIPAVNYNQNLAKWLKNREKESKECWGVYNDEQAFGEMVAYANVYDYLQAHNLIEGEVFSNVDC